MWLLLKIRSAIFMFLHPQYIDDGRDDYVDPFNDFRPHLRADDYRMLLEMATTSFFLFRSSCQYLSAPHGIVF